MVSIVPAEIIGNTSGNAGGTTKQCAMEGEHTREHSLVSLLVGAVSLQITGSFRL